VTAGGPARLVLSGVEEAPGLAQAVAAAHGHARFVEGRLEVTAAPERLIHAAGRVGGAPAAAAMRAAVLPAVAAWLAPPPDLVTPAGRLPTASRPTVMGVLNVTPDSFSDGGVAIGAEDHPRTALEAGAALFEAGADLVDVGGESTRPGAASVDEAEELRRVLPVVEGLAAAGGIVSIDTTKAAVARAAVAAGAAIVNDVSAGRDDPALLPTVAELEVPYVLMHRQGTPRTMQQDPTYVDVVGEVFDELADGLAALESAGMARDRVVIDPGIGFGKTLQHNLALLRHLRGFTSLGRPVLLGTSRKSFLGRLTGVDEAERRLEGSLATAVLGVEAGASLLRVHDVLATVRAVVVAHAVRTGEEGPWTASP
jgi:dihydropteroate synthase